MRVTSVLLVTFALRGLIPAGYMPSSDRPFTLEICPEGFPADLLERGRLLAQQHEQGLAHEHGLHDEKGAQDPGQGPHQHGSVQSQHCVFSAPPAAGPAAHAPLVAAFFEGQPALLPDYSIPILKARRFRIQQPRAPPALS